MVNRILLILKIIYQTKKITFLSPPNKKYLVIDSISLQIGELFVDSDDYFLLDIRGESINIYIFLLSILKKPSLNIKKIYKNYIQTFITFINPEYVITFNDNNPFLLSLNLLKNTNFLIFQNGYRYKEISYKNINSKSNLHFFTLTKSRADFLKSQHSLKAYPIGSVLSNLVPKVQAVDENKIVFISQYRIKRNRNKLYYYEGLNHSQVYKYEIRILKVLINILKRTKYKLIILGAISEVDSIEEYEFYKNYVDNKNIFFRTKIKKNNEKFDFLDSASFIVGLDSTLLYECLGRGKKTFFASCRGSIEFGNSLNPFFHPFEKEDYGLYWLNIFSEEKLSKMLTNFLKVESSLSKYHDEIPYNPKLNSIEEFINIME